MSHGLKKNLFFQDQRLPAMITQYIKNHKNNTTTFASEIDKFIIWDNILNENNIHIYRIVQKAVYNAYKYAFAKNCQVYLQWRKIFHIVKSSDDGVGFNLVNEKEGIILKNIKERTNFLKAHLLFQALEKRVQLLKLFFKSF